MITTLARNQALWWTPRLLCCLGPVLGLSWVCLGPVLACLGPVSGRLGLSWGCLGPVLGCLGPVLGLSWAVLGCLGPVLGCLGLVLGLSWVCLGPVLACLGPVLACLGPVLGDPWGQEPPKKPKDAPKMDPKIAIVRDFFGVRFWTLFGTRFRRVFETPGNPKTAISLGGSFKNGVLTR